MTTSPPESSGSPEGETGKPATPKRGRVVRTLRLLSGFNVLSRAGKTLGASVGDATDSASAVADGLKGTLRQTLQRLATLRGEYKDGHVDLNAEPLVAIPIDQTTPEFRQVIRNVRFGIAVFMQFAAAGAALLVLGAGAVSDGFVLKSINHFLAGASLFVFAWFKVADCARDYSTLMDPPGRSRGILTLMVRPVRWIPYGDEELASAGVWFRVGVVVALAATVFAYMVN